MDFVVERSQHLRVWSRCSELFAGERTLRISHAGLLPDSVTSASASKCFAIFKSSDAISFGTRMTVVFVEFHFRGNIVEERAIDELLLNPGGEVNAVTGKRSRLQT